MTTPLVADGGRVVCEHCTVAERPLARLRGLLGRRALAADEGLLLRPTASVHTWFMRFPIDVVFLDRDLRVLRVVPHLRPWRFASCRGARATLELAAGEAARRRLAAGERLRLVDVRARRTVAVASHDRPYLTVVSFLLERAGYDVVLASAGVQGNPERRPDAVVLDVDGLLVAPRSMGVIRVADDPATAQDGRPVVAKWGPFDELRRELERTLAAVGA